MKFPNRTRSYRLSDADVAEILSKGLSRSLTDRIELQAEAHDLEQLRRACGIEYRDGAEWMPIELAALFAITSYWWYRVLPFSTGMELRMGEPTMIGLRWRW